MLWIRIHQGTVYLLVTRELSCLILTFFSSLETHWKATSWLTGKTVARQEAASPTTAGSVGLPVHLSMEKSRPMIIVTEAGAKDQEGDEAAVERVQPGLARAEFRTLQSSKVYITLVRAESSVTDLTRLLNLLSSW